jgi:MoaA/NifB/PqqE/SkfB family radical SAM enzyme
MSPQHEILVTLSNPAHLGPKLAALPILILNVHSTCNCRCVMCDIWKRNVHEQVRAESLERHRESLRALGVRHVVLSGGEPLLHSNLRELCEFFRQQDIRLTLLTTGLLLLKRANEVSALFDDVIISIDGPQKVHDAIRNVNGAFDLIEKGIAAVRERRPHLPISCRTTVQKANHRHLRATVSAAKILRCDSISFLAADLTSEAFNRPVGWSSERQNQIALDAMEVSDLECEVELLIEEHQTDISNRYIAENAEKLRRIPHHFRAYLGQVSAQAPSCNAPWVSAVVEVDGSVRPCFFHPSVGNINMASLQEVVNGDPARAFRQSLDVATNPTCQRCVCSLNYHDA